VGASRLILTGSLLVVAIAIAAALAYLRLTGLDARAQPSALERTVAVRMRRWAIPGSARRTPNPVPASQEALAEGMAHYADHCATCHANDGSGDTEIGRGLFPKAPDMRLAATQVLTDGELFYIIEHGIRFTGMPGWGTGTAAGEESTWQLVQFIRHLPRLSEDELETMKDLNPQSPGDIRRQIEEDRFLNPGGER
jgi:mono/diheme cytochrome c family protein